MWEKIENLFLDIFYRSPLVSLHLLQFKSIPPIRKGKRNRKIFINMYRNIYTLNIYKRKIGHRENQLYLLSQVLWDVVPCSGVQTNLSWGTDHTWGTYQKNPGLQTTKSTTPMGIPHLPTQKEDSMITWDNPNHHNHTIFRSWSTQGQPGLGKTRDRGAWGPGLLRWNAQSNLHGT